MRKLNAGAWIRAIPSLGLRRGELDAFVDQAREDGFIPRDASFRTKQDCIDALRRARSAYWSAEHVKATAASRPKSLCLITASEVNAWLRSLPPTELDP